MVHVMAAIVCRPDRAQVVGARLAVGAMMSAPPRPGIVGGATAGAR